MATPRRPSVNRIVGAVALLLVLASSSASVSGNPSSDTSSPTTSGGPSTTVGPKPIAWGECEDNPAPIECATVTVPVDYDHPEGDTLEVAIVKVPATKPSERIGSLLVNPGGPGGSGIDLATQNLWPTPVSQRFDIIGFDPRGVGQSTPLDCHRTLEQMYSVDPAPRTAPAVDKLESVSKTFVRGCDAKYGDLLAHLGTRNVARDMDQIRKGLGEDKISYLGYSYGTSIGQVYADLFPTHVRAMVLDGVVKLGQPGIEASAAQGVAFDQALDRFLDDCKADASCPLGTDPSAVFDRVKAKLKVKPLPTHDGDRTLPIGLFHLGVGQALYAQFMWPQLARALDDADGGDGTALLQLADQYLGRHPDGSFDSGFEIYFSVSCLDWSWPRKPNDYLTAGRAVATKAPRLGEGIVTDYIRCAYWPTPPQPLTPPEAKGSPLIVVVSTSEDPATP
jgi:pimeloyl-ACP methyl ester carboxylesterase